MCRTAGRRCPHETTLEGRAAKAAKERERYQARKLAAGGTYTPRNAEAAVAAPAVNVEPSVKETVKKAATKPKKKAVKEKDNTAQVQVSRNKVVTLTPGKWDATAEMAYQEGQSICFAVEYAKRLGPDAKVRVFWNWDDRFEHAMAYNPHTETLTDSADVNDVEIFNEAWEMSHEEEPPEWTDYDPNELPTIDRGRAFYHTCTQNYTIAKSYMDVLPDHIKLPEPTTEQA